MNCDKRKQPEEDAYADSNVRAKRHRIEHHAFEYVTADVWRCVSEYLRPCDVASLSMASAAQYDFFLGTITKAKIAKRRGSNLDPFSTTTLVDRGSCATSSNGRCSLFRTVNLTALEVVCRRSLDCGFVTNLSSSLTRLELRLPVDFWHLGRPPCDASPNANGGASAVVVAVEWHRLSRLTSLSMSIGDDASLGSSIGRMTNLTELKIAGRQTGCYEEDKFSRLTNLTSLNLDKIKYKETSIVSHLTKLRTLSFENTMIEDDAVTNLTNLETLYLAFGYGFFDDATSASALSDFGISHLLKLRELFVGRLHVRVTDDSISKLTNLTSLRVYRSNFVTDSSVSSLTSLKSLHLYGSSVTDEGVSALSNLTHLHWDCAPGITLSSVRFLTNLESLEQSSADSDHLWFSELSKLKRLGGWNGSGITGTLVSHLADNLVKLEISIPLGEVGTDRVCDSSLSLLTNLTHLKMNSMNEITDASLSALTKLTRLEAMLCKNVSDASLRFLVNLEYVALAYVPRVTHLSLNALTNATHISAQCTGLDPNKFIPSRRLETFRSSIASDDPNGVIMVDGAMITGNPYEHETRW